jgi:predicted nucleic acid-binding protein
MKEQHPGLSFEDCSVWHHARVSGGVLVTGDGLLRKKARVEGIEVRGIIFLITELKTQNILGIQDSIRLLDQLKQINPRLPIQEIENLIYTWKMELNLNR